MPQTATYIYCLVEQARRPAPIKAARGLPGAAAPEILPVGKSLWAVAAEVPLAIYGSNHLEERLKDIKWVADVALAHEAIIEQFASRRGTAVVPMKLFTMFSTRERAVEDLRGRIREVGAILKRIRGCQEWGVRVTRRLREPSSRANAVPQQASTGTAFLTAKIKARDDARAAMLNAAGAAEAAYTELARLARASRRREAPEAATTPPLVDAAFLVRADRTARFRAAARRSASACRKAGADLALTGPWPAYNFVERA
jgi:hypothetical protein